MKEVDYLSTTGIFAPDFLDYLPQLRFTGDVWAIPEGRLFFPDEPILEVTAPVIEAQAVETFIINQVNLQSMIATKAARCCYAATGKVVTDFSLRRTHGADAGMKVALSSYIGGAASTSNVLAGEVYGIPPSGTMAPLLRHQLPQRDRRLQGLCDQLPSTLDFPDRHLRDTIAGARNAANVAHEMQAWGNRLVAVRLDSGDYASLSRQVRAILDDSGLDYVKIVASGGLDEYDVELLTHAGAPIDIFGIGTRMGVLRRCPLYRYGLQDGELRHPPCDEVQRSKGLPPPARSRSIGGVNDAGVYVGDIISLRDEPGLGGEPLLQHVMHAGQMMADSPTLHSICETAERDLAHLDAKYKALTSPPAYPVQISPGLHHLTEATKGETHPETRLVESESQA